jgi:transcriptional regulator NrdR family protein
MKPINVCPKCHSVAVKIIDSREEADGTRIRRRKCIICGKRWSTREIHLDDFEELSHDNDFRSMYDQSIDVMDRSIRYLMSIKNDMERKKRSYEKSQERKEV